MKRCKLSDQELVGNFVGGDQTSLEVLLHRYKSKVFSYILKYVRNQYIAEDIFQETFIKVIKSLKSDNYKDEGRFISWVMRIAHNLVIDYFRKSKHMKMVKSDDSCPDVFNNKKFSDKNIEDSIIQQHVFSQIRDLVLRLPYEQKEIVIMRLKLDMSFKEIADINQISINTALGRMRYAVINIRKMIEEHNLSVAFN